MGHWIFQSNPEYFDLPQALQEVASHDNVLVFLAKKHDIARGDSVFLCYAGRKNPGLYATAIVQTRPDTILPEEWQRKYGRGKPLPADSGVKTPLRVRLKISRVLDVPVSRGEIYQLQEMARHPFVTVHAGTNFKLTPEQATALELLIAAPRAIPSATPASNRSDRDLLSAGSSGNQPSTPLQNIHEAHLEELIVCDLDQIEPGLTLIGRQYDAGPSGRIDLLCQSSCGDIVVVELKRIGVRAAGVVEQTMAYVGWVRKHLARPDQHVRGVIVGGKPDAKLRYAVDGIPNLEFRTLNISIGEAN
jgi:Endonuclease NucS C-terminal domain